MFGRIKFFIESLKKIRQVGTITPSGSALSKKAASFLDTQHKTLIVELGAGNGPITRKILERISEDSCLIAIELDSKFCDQLRTIQDDRLIVVNDSIENIAEILKAHNKQKIDYVVSAIPFILFDRSKAKIMIQTVQKHMKNQSKWLQIHYSKSIIDLYKSLFKEVHTHRIFKNIPPAYVFECLHQ